MPDQEIYDRALDEPAPGTAALPDEEYYQHGQRRQRGARRAGLGLALVLLGLMLLAAQLFGRGLVLGGGTRTVVDQTLPGSRIELTTSSADVEVATWSQPDIRVEAIQHGGSNGDYQIDVTRSGDTVRVSDSSRGFFWCLFCSRELSYRISVPASAQANIDTTSGDIDIRGVSGAVVLGTVSGDVRAAELAGGLAAKTTSGEVRLTNAAGKLSVGSISGDVRLEGGQVDGATVKTTSGEVDLAGVAGLLSLTTVSGDIKVIDARDAQLTFATTSGDISYAGTLARGGANQISSISGDVTLELPDNSGFRLDASTASGDLSSDFTLNQGTTSSRTLSGVTGAGDATLKVSTTSGGIRIVKG